MITFLPIADFAESAKVLDHKRLGKQRVEAKQLVNSIIEENGWSRHPASIMWKWNLRALMRYHDVMVTEWINRGYQNTMVLYQPRAYEMPIWFGDPFIHASHRSQLLGKDYPHYSQFGWDDPVGRMPYIWPKWGD